MKRNALAVLLLALLLAACGTRQQSQGGITSGASSNMSVSNLTVSELGKSLNNAIGTNNQLLLSQVQQSVTGKRVHWYCLVYGVEADGVVRGTVLDDNTRHPDINTQMMALTDLHGVPLDVAVNLRPDSIFEFVGTIGFQIDSIGKSRLNMQVETVVSVNPTPAP